MSIVKMKRLGVIASQQVRRDVLSSLYKLGCVEIEERLPEEADDLQLSRINEDIGSEQNRSSIEKALKLLVSYAPQKKSFLSPKRSVAEVVMFDEEHLNRAVEAAGEINSLWARQEDAKSKIARQESHILSLRPWENHDVPLNNEGTDTVPLVLGTIPGQANMAEVTLALDEAGLAYSLEVISSDSEQHYLELMYYRGDEDAIMAGLKPFGFSRVNFKDIGRTAKLEIEYSRQRIKDLQADIQRYVQQIAAFAPQREEMENAVDAFSQEAVRDRVLSSIGHTGKTVVFFGWVPAEAEDKVAQVLIDLGCAYSFEDPQEGDDVPTAMKNGKLADPLNAVTEMYGMPTYNSLIDPNPLMMPFYVVFFGFIMADMGYGLLLCLGTALMLKLKKPTGNMKRMLTLFFYCGVMTTVVGALTGGFFADALAAFSGKFLGQTIAIKPIWFDPLTEPMTFLVLAIALGAVQVLFGMGVNARRQIMNKDYIGALFSCGTWYMVFLGGGLYLGLPMLAPNAPAIIAQIGLYLCIAGVAIMIVIGAITGKGFGRFTKGFGQVYNIIGIFSDILSYSRIMALALSGAVVGQVFNKMGTMAGGVLGIVIFIVAFVVGHLFNLAISGLGAYVHTSRLQYIEFFGRFYESGGRPFKPMINKTKYTEIV